MMKIYFDLESFEVLVSVNLTEPPNISLIRLMLIYSFSDPFYYS